jgi:hypothetical protein
LSKCVVFSTISDKKYLQINRADPLRHPKVHLHQTPDPLAPEWDASYPAASSNERTALYMASAGRTAGPREHGAPAGIFPGNESQEYFFGNNR